MAELNLKQIIDKLNSEFTGDVRKLVFWYDANAEFQEDIDTIELENAKVLHLESDNQFYMKYFLECEDTTTNYLVYAPFGKPTVRENHLADTIKYSKEFFADKTSLIVADLGFGEQFKPVINEYIDFFKKADLLAKFNNLQLDVLSIENIEIAAMCVLCKCKTVSFDEVLRIVLSKMDSEEENNSYLKLFEKYNLLDAFWRIVFETFGYKEESPSLESLMYSMFTLYTDSLIGIPVAWDNFAKNIVARYTRDDEEIKAHPEKEKESRVYKTGNSIAFIDNIMNSSVYGEHFDVISDKVYRVLSVNDYLKGDHLENWVTCEVYKQIDERIISFITERLSLEDVSIKLADISIPELIELRKKTHFGKHKTHEYNMLDAAWNLISNSKYINDSSLKNIIKNYTDSTYKMDMWYRQFYYSLDKVQDNYDFYGLATLIENIYTNNYLSKVCVNWNQYFAEEINSVDVLKQKDFYNRHVRNEKNQLVVIISDALRYEVGVALYEKLLADKRCTTKIMPMVSTLPSITEYGMAALLPHRNLELTDEYKILVDGVAAKSTKQRQEILQSVKVNSKCFNLDEIASLNVADIKALFKDQDVVYIYHNQIDARGDKLSTENEVFEACEEAINEIYKLIDKKLISASKKHIIITADHGFLYKRERLEESDKISALANTNASVARRYALGNDELDLDGVKSVGLSHVMKTNDARKVSYPVGPDIFKAPGSGQNYVHGGSSPQEMIIPVIDVITERGAIKTTNAELALVSLSTRITNLITSLDFVQTEPVSDIVKETSYRIYFVSENGVPISNEQICVVDKKDADSTRRMYRLRFNFKNQQYNKSQKYYLVAYDEKTSLEVMRHEVIMDIAFADDFGFGF